MRILSARIQRARRDRESGFVSAVVALTVLHDRQPARVFVAVAVPARAIGAAPLRHRVLGAAKLALIRDSRPQEARAA